MSRYLKQIIVCRNDLSMPRGKLAAMVAHASMSFILKAFRDTAAWPGDWENAFSAEQVRWLTELDPGLEAIGQVSMAKIVCAANSEAELLALEQAAQAAKVCVHRVVDSGHSHNPPGTLVCLALGPDWPEKLDPLTGHLKIYR